MKGWLTGGFRHFFMFTHVDEDVSIYFFSMGGNKHEPSFHAAVYRNSCEQQPKPWLSAVYIGR